VLNIFVDDIEKWVWVLGHKLFSKLGITNAVIAQLLDDRPKLAQVEHLTE
jgi:hypothetical protein